MLKVQVKTDTAEFWEPVWLGSATAAQANCRNYMMFCACVSVWPVVSCTNLTTNHNYVFGVRNEAFCVD